MADLDPVVAVLLGVWLTLFGACIGSFLNVVVYRLPLGKSLSNPPSHCPKCNHPIRWFDNVPVFGWLLLRGKCRDCKEPISVRYPMVEAICGGIFCTISILTLRRGGDASLMEVFWFVSALSGLVLTFFAAGLIEQEGKSIPLRLFIPIAVLAPMMPFLWNDSFHVSLYGLGKMETSLLVGIGGSIGRSFIVAAFFPWRLGKEQTIVWGMTAILLGVYLGEAGFLTLFLTLIISVILQLIQRLNVLTPYLVLAFSVFVFIVLILSITTR